MVCCCLAGWASGWTVRWAGSGSSTTFASITGRTGAALPRTGRLGALGVEVTTVAGSTLGEGVAPGCWANRRPGRRMALAQPPRGLVACRKASAAPPAYWALVSTRGVVSSCQKVISQAPAELSELM